MRSCGCTSTRSRGSSRGSRAGSSTARGVEDPSEQKQIADIIGKLYRCFVECDAMLAEINPLIVTPEGEVKALDSKFTVDDSALYRHPDIAEFRDTSAADPLEAFAREKGVIYVKLDGSWASSATAPAWRCRPSTSWSSRAASRRTSATSAAAAAPKASSTRSR